ncbi:MAG: hypothetical protein GQ570_05000 [Helicobacteraceae bacterium]|nr:hypothetical protein [Helicobacteraceae bacterium]
MKELYGTLIIFFYFIKYPLVIFLPVGYIYLGYENNTIMNVLWLTSLILILKDWFFPYKKPDNCLGVKK